MADTEEQSSFVIASFSQNFPIATHPATLIDESKKSSSSTKRKKYSKYCVRVDGFKMQYVGEWSSSSSATSTPSGSEWCLMIKNKRTGDVVFKPAQYVTFHPRMEKTEELTKTLIDKDNFRESRDLLTLKYGSKMKKRALEAKMASTVSEESLSKMINMAVSEVKDSSFLQRTLGLDGVLTGASPAKQFSSVLPRFNPEATCPAEVYDMTDILAPQESALLDEEALQLSIMKFQEIKTRGFSDIVIELYFALPSQQDVRRQCCAYVLFLHYLLSLCKLASNKRFVDVNDLIGFGVPKDLLRIILDRYTEPMATVKRSYSKRMVTPANKDRLLAHCIVLILNLNNFSVNLAKLGLAVQNSVDKLATKCRALGCSTKHKEIAVLTGPPKNTGSHIPVNRKRKFGAR